MRRLLPVLAALAFSLPVLRADDSFTRSLSPEDFQAAGLSKLNPDELAKLDALIRGEKTGAVAKAKEETVKAVTAQVTAQVTEEVRKKTQEEDRKAESKRGVGASFMERMKVVLKPGTEIEYTTLDATLVPPFKGWHYGTLFTLSNGQQWSVTDEASYWSPQVNDALHVRIVPGMLGTFFLEIDHGGRPRARYVGMAPGFKPPADAGGQEPQK
jgi:hypothetical protein